MTLSPQDYNDIAKKVYQLDPVKYPNTNTKLGVGTQFEVGGKNYKVIDAIGNDDEPTDNGLQAMAVAEVG